MAGEEQERHSTPKRGCAAGGYFYPLFMKPFGFWTSSRLTVLKIAGSKTTVKNGIKFAQALNNLMQQLSGRLFQHNFKIICSRVQIDTHFKFGDFPTLIGMRWLYICKTRCFGDCLRIICF